MNIKVLNNDGELEKFNSSKIRNKIIEETGLDKNEVDKITQSVLNTIKQKYTEEISTSSIRSLINSQLIKRGYLVEEEKSRKLGMSRSDIDKLINEGCKDNANIGYSPEMIAKYVYDANMKEYALLTMPQECAEAHKNGLIHCLSGNNDLIVKINDVIQMVNIVDIVDSYDEIDYYVPSVNPKTGEISWKKIIDGACTGVKPVYEIEFAKGYKIECTNNHKFLKFQSRTNSFAEDYDVSINDFHNSYNIRLGSLNKIPYDEIDENYYESAFYGFFLGDGTFQYKKLQFHLVKQDKIDYIVGLLKKLNVEYTIRDSYKSIYISCDNFLDIKDKETLIDLKINHKGLLEGLINSDGYVSTHGGNNTNYLEFDSTNKFIADLFFISCLTYNIRPSYQRLEKKNNNDVYRLIVQNNFVNDLLESINLRKGHKNRMSNNCSSRNVHELTSLTPKKVTFLGRQLVYNITVKDNHNFMAGTQGFVLTQNCHDLEYYNTRPNCMNMDLRFFAKNGLKIDGKGDMGSVAKPAKSLEVLLNHMLQVWMAGATVFSGGQGYVNFNTLLAPFCKGRSYEEIKQAIQGFIFNCNMSLICRGGQVLFSSIALDLSIPPVLADEPAISFGGVAIGTYKDYQEEADLIFRAVCEVSNEKDGEGAWHRFPNIMFNIREGDLDKFEGNCKLLHETGANNPTIYYNNCTDIEKSIMGCRTALPMNYTGDYHKDCVNTGNFMYNTINLPLLALEVDGDIDRFYDLLDDICEVCYKSLIHRRETVMDVIYNKHISDFLLQKDKDTGEPLWDIKYTTMTLGYCGLNEALVVLLGNGIEDEESEELGVQIIEFINNKKDQFKERDGLRWSVIGSPAESTAHRFAEIIKQKYPDAYVQGVKGSYYLTNSHHIPVSSNAHWMRHIENAKKFHHLSMGGALLHIWSGEVWSDPEAIWKLNKRILEYGNPVFWAYSKVFTFCRQCNFTINDRLEECPICKSKDLRIYDRITGYYLGVDTFNSGKLKEFEDRYRHNINKESV